MQRHFCQIDAKNISARETFLNDENVNLGSGGDDGRRDTFLGISMLVVVFRSVGWKKGEEVLLGLLGVLSF